MMTKDEEGNNVFDPTEAAEMLFLYLRHGDEKHQQWLKKSLHAFFRGEERPELD